MQFSYKTTTSETDWRDWIRRNIDVSDGGLSLSQQTAVRATPLDESIRDIAIDSNGILYLLSESGSVTQYNPGTDSRQEILRADGPAADATAIGASASQLFVVGEDEILTVSLQRNRQTGTVNTTLSNATEFAHHGGTMYAIDDGKELTAIGGDAPSFEWPIDFAVSRDNLLALDIVDGKRVLRTAQAADADDPLLGSDGFVVSGEQFVPVAVASPGGAVIIAGTCLGSSRDILVEYSRETGDCRELAELDGICHKLVGRVQDNGLRSLYAIIGDNRRCQALSEQRENVRHPRRNKYLGMAVTQFDSGVRSIDWHRLVFEQARSSVNTQVRIYYHASDHDQLLGTDTAHTDGGVARQQPHHEQTLWEETLSQDDRERLAAIGIETIQELTQLDPDTAATQSNALSRESVVSLQQTAFEALEDHIDDHWTVATELETSDILLREARGRYLNVAVELIGTPTASPLVDSLTVYCPRKSYLRYMPELYQQDKQSAAFLEQFLSVFESSFTEIQSEIETITRYFDPEGTPADSLDWLEGWLAADEYRDWPESARREYLRRAPELYKMRGTRAGLREIIELYLRHVTDGEQNGRTGPGSSDTVTGHRLFFMDRSAFDEIKQDTNEEAYATLLPNNRSVVLFCGPFESAEHREAIKTIVETEKPAHVDANVLSLEEEFVLGSDSFLGINTELDTESFSLGEATLGKDAYLGATD